MASFQMGPGTLSVPMALFRANRQRLCEALRRQPLVDDATYVLLAGGKDVGFNDTDVNFVFRQESYFQYLFGVKEPQCYGALHVQTARTTLFVPRLSAEYAIWLGPLHTLADFQAMYEVDDVAYVSDLDGYFKERRPSTILTLCGINTDSGVMSQPATFDGLEQYTVDSELLYPVLAECRVIKTDAEVEVLRYVAKVSSDAHIEVMRTIRPGQSEYESESKFLHHTYAVGGCRHVSYTCICGSGTNSAVLHYGHAAAPNARLIRDGDMCLFDMGANYCGYAADITCSFPANGRFTDDQRFIYNAVLDSRNAVLQEAREGVSWVDMHRLACRTLLTRLKEGGVLRGDVDDMLTAGLAGIFMPHGLGHLLGLDVHDVGGYLSDQPSRPTEPWLQRLRFARVLKAGMYVTVEPGCYFIAPLMDRALSEDALKQFINVDVFQRFRNFGGVRIEDDVLIKKDGNENFTFVPRTVDEIEATMKVARCD